MAAVVGRFGALCMFHRNFFKTNALRNLSATTENINDKSTLFSSSRNNVVISEKEDNLHMIAINRPEKRNCVNTHVASELLKAFQKFEEDDTAEAAVLYGVGGNFCAGFDLSQLAEGNVKDFPTTNGPMGPSRMLTSKPVIAAIGGYAVAGGMELALLCDLRVMEETAIMGVFCRRFGVPLIDGGTVRLPHMIGLSRALDLILTGRPVEAKEALEIGLVNYVVACGTAVGRAISLARCIAKFPQECLKADRHSAYYSTFEAKSLEDALRFEFENGKKIILEESVRGAQNFMKGLGKHGKFNFDKQLQQKNAEELADKLRKDN